MYRFIIDGIITMPIALYGFLMFPDVPTTTKAFYLSEEVGNLSLLNVLTEVNAMLVHRNVCYLANG